MSASSSSYGSTDRLPPLLLHSSQSSQGEGAGPYVAEFLGTFVVVFSVGCVLLSPGSAAWGATAVGAVLTAMVYATCQVSGGYLNPAVAFSLGLIGVLRWPVVIRYWFLQLGAGLVAALILRAMYAPDDLKTGPVPPFTWEYAATAEVIYTFMLCFVVNNCVASKRNNCRDDSHHFSGLAIGFVAVASIASIGKISGAAINPAIATGFAAAGGGFCWIFVWIASELLGAVLAAIMFRAVRPEEYNPPEGELLEDYEPPLHVRCASEFLGAFVLVLTFGLSLVSASPSCSFAVAAALVCMVYSLVDVSGAHFNPAVTLAVVLSGREKCSAVDGTAYVVCQLVGACCAGLLYAQFHAAGHHSGLTYGLTQGEAYGPNTAGVVELFFTLAISYAVLACTTVATPLFRRTKRNFFAALVIGACMASGRVCIGRVSGGSLNPAVSIGVATANLAHHGRKPPPPFARCMIYSAWELTGGLLAAVAFSVTHPGEYKKAPLLAK